jgi:endoglucanase
MFRTFILTIILAAFSMNAHAADSCTYKSTGGLVKLKRGVNLTNWWEDDRSQAINDEDMGRLQAQGFDFVRVPLSTRWFTITDKDEQGKKLAQLRCDVIGLLNHNLSVVLDLHANGTFQDRLADDTDHAAANLESIWKQFRSVVAGLPGDHVLLGIYNEPNIENDPWWIIQRHIVADLRPLFPENTFVVTAGAKGEPWNLANSKAYADKNVIYDFHFYQPMYLTHHGANWFPHDDPIRDVTPITYPVDPSKADQESNPNVKEYIEGGWNRAALAKFIDGIAIWAKENDVKVACLEFGIYKKYVDRTSRANWLRDMRELMEKDNIAWAMWEYRGSFGMLDDGWVADKEVVKALGLNDIPNP